MTPARFVQCLEVLHWSPDQLAGIFECDKGLVEAWVMGLEEIPPKAAAWIETLARLHEHMEAEKPKSLRGMRAKGLPPLH